MNAKDYNAMILVSHVSTIKEINVLTLIVLNYLSYNNIMKINVNEVKITVNEVKIISDKI
jgi:hypothetical protein